MFRQHLLSGAELLVEPSLVPVSLEVESECRLDMQGGHVYIPIG